MHPQKKAPSVARFELGTPDVKRILAGFAIREEIIGLLVNAPQSDAIGAALSYLVVAAQRDPGQVRAVLNSTMPDIHGIPRRIKDHLTL